MKRLTVPTMRSSVTLRGNQRYGTPSYCQKTLYFKASITFFWVFHISHYFLSHKKNIFYFLYSKISCEIWNGKIFAPETVKIRLRRKLKSVPYLIWGLVILILGKVLSDTYSHLPTHRELFNTLIR